MQRAYITKLMELAEKDRNVLHLLSDSGTAYDEMFKGYFPTQCINFGIAEELKVAAAAGLATCGKIPFLFTSGAFLAYRAFEFIRDDICFSNLNVKLVGMGSGLSWSSLGPSHHTTEDVGVLRTLPGLKILSPATPEQLSACVEEAYETNGPVYIRMGMSNEPEYFTKERAFLPCQVLEKGHEITVVSTGTILEEVIKAKELLKKEGTQVNLISISRLKPFDPEPVFSLKGKRIITVEEHNINGGLGSILAEAVAEAGLKVPIKRIGLNDVFASGYGSLFDVRATNSLDGASIARTIKTYLEQGENR